MKIFRSESFVDYSTYTFNYANYCLKEDRSELPEIYDKGFLPYSNDTSLSKEIYYLARSLRVDLDVFKASSENRRVDRKIQELNPVFRLIEKKDFDLKDQEFLDYCHHFTQQRFSESISKERLQYIFDAPSFSHLFEFSIDNRICGYVICILEGDMLHYWFAFFDLNRPEFGLGKWMMYSVIHWAQQQGLKHVYLGTCYGTKSLYKVRDFKGLSFYDGNRWNDNVKLLKQKCKCDEEFEKDEFKQDTDLFLERL